MNSFEKKALVKFIEERDCKVREVQVKIKDVGEPDKPNLRVVEFSLENR